MRIISHRGNINGPVPEKENRPSYIDCALQLGLDVELDIRYINGKYWLGHDTPDFEVSEKWITKRKDRLWFHCKNLEAVTSLKFLHPNIITFCHASDSYVLVNNGTIWVDNLLLTLNNLCIIPLINKEQVNNWINFNVYGVCTDYTRILEKKLQDGK